MCGIAGFVNGDSRPAERSAIERMTRSLHRRGPDDEGFHLAGPTALGHRRLSIIDIDGGAQPLANEDDTVYVTFNGEIYNEPELRDRLQALGHRFRTRTDTEVLVHLYEEYGDHFMDRLNGMFALAIWDQTRRRLILARDRMGQKPLYYAVTPRRTLVFGSEPKALLEHPEIAPALDPGSLARYLFYEYVPAPHSIWAGVRKLPRAGALVWEDGAAKVFRYWDPPLPEPALAGSLDRAAGSFWEEFRASVARHIRSDVPLGVFLSGGIDSSSVAAALAEIQLASSIHTFSIGFDDPSFDESRYARIASAALGTKHFERTFSVESLIELLPDVFDWLDEPFGDASILPTHLLSRFAREHVKVCLGGDGADELLAGYPTFAAERALGVYNRLPQPAQRLAKAAVNRLPVNHSNISFDFKLKQFLKGASEPAAIAHQRWLGSFSGPEIAEILLEPPALDVEEELRAESARIAVGADPLSRSLAVYQENYLAEDILTKVDRASMARGLEVRAPFLDAQLVDLVLRMPPRYKYRAGATKRVLRRAVGDKLPAELLKRPKKGFGIPVARWLRGPLAPLMDRLFNADLLDRQGLFRPESIARLVGEHQAGVKDHRKPLWTLLVFQLWHERRFGV